MQQILLGEGNSDNKFNRLPYLLSLPQEQQREILSRHAASIKYCELCKKPVGGNKAWYVGGSQVDPENNPDAMYVYKLHGQCLRREIKDPGRKSLLRIEARAEREFPLFLDSLLIVGGAQ
jgi:hypothetical protein